MTQEPTRPPVWWYRIATTLLIGGVSYLVFSGRLAESLRSFGSAAHEVPPEAFDRVFLTNVLWIASIFPFFATVHWLVTRRRAERTMASYWNAARTVVLVAARGATPRFDDAVDPAEPPEEDRLGAVLKGLAFGLGVPSFFWFAPVPLPHTPPVAAWLVITGLFMGSSVYCIERARPYINRDWLTRQSGRFFGKTYTASPANYDGPGKRWIRFYWVCAVLMMISWLAGGPLAFFTR